MTRVQSRSRRRVIVIALLAISVAVSAASAAPQNDDASCVAKFNVAVGTPGEYQRVFHQDMLGRDVSFFARLGQDCPFG